MTKPDKEFMHVLYGNDSLCGESTGPRATLTYIRSSICYYASICPECKAHEDYPFLVLASLGEEPQTEFKTSGTTTGRISWSQSAAMENGGLGVGAGKI